MSLISYEPWSLVSRFHRDLDQLVGRQIADREGELTAVADWVPAVDIVEHEDKFVLRADVPGVDPADIELSMEGGELTLSGSRISEDPESDGGFRRIERRSGRFLRRFNLPETADAEGISAKGAHGVLEVQIPKQAKVLPRRITVNAA